MVSKMLRLLCGLVIPFAALVCACAASPTALEVSSVLLAPELGPLDHDRVTCASVMDPAELPEAESDDDDRPLQVYCGSPRSDVHVDGLSKRCLEGQTCVIKLRTAPGVPRGPPLASC